MTGSRWSDPSGLLRIGISSCLLGEKVRWDGNHKRDAYLVEILGPHVEWVPVCPEVESGMPVPRPPIRLSRRDKGNVRLVPVHGGGDLTDRMMQWSRRRARDLDSLDLCGFILKKDSPSCGMDRVKVHLANGLSVRDGRGIFAGVLMEKLAALPVEEEGRLNDPCLRENFVERVFAYRRLKALFSARWTLGDLVAFHTAHKLQILSHSETAYREIGRLVATAKAVLRPTLRDRYEDLFMRALAGRATTRRHTNVLQHMMGHLRGRLDDPRRRELAATIEDYRRGLVPLVVPLTLIGHHARALGIDYLTGQAYLQPHPKELMLRNHV